MKTWNKFLPEYKVVVLNYSTIGNWLDKNIYSKELYKNMRLAVQADAIRCAILKKYGGIWFDCDTILTSDKIRNIIPKESGFTLIGLHIGVIFAKKNAKVLKIWQKEIQKRLFKFELSEKHPKLYELFYNKRFKHRLRSNSLFGNSIINPLFEKLKNEKLFKSIDRESIFALPEVNFYKSNTEDSFYQKYLDFYFTDNDNSSYALENSNGIILLHNSWTPKEYKEMSQAEFLSKNKTMTNILKKILEL